MYVTDLSNAPKREVEGLVSHIFLEEGDAPGGEMSVTWVDVEPGNEQPPHSHPPQQVYVVTRGTGRCRDVGEDLVAGVDDAVLGVRGDEHHRAGAHLALLVADP